MEVDVVRSLRVKVKVRGKVALTRVAAGSVASVLGLEEGGGLEVEPEKEIVGPALEAGAERPVGAVVVRTEAGNEDDNNDPGRGVGEDD